MAADPPGDPAAGAVDAALAEWRQGDCVLGEHWFVARHDVTHPLSSAAKAAAAEGAELGETQVPGLVVVSQTCDIVRSCDERPYVEVCPLVEVDDAVLGEVARARRPALAYVPAFHAQRLVADLDRIMTLEKPVVAKWTRIAGHTSDAEARAFAHALSRKRVRFAFPDDFTLFARKLQARLSDKHDKNTDEGWGLRALREIRVQASPQWDADSVELFFWFVRNDDQADFEGKSWATLLAAWLELVPQSGRFSSVEGQVASLEEMTGADYVGSDPLDLDSLSLKRAPR